MIEPERFIATSRMGIDYNAGKAYKLAKEYPQIVRYAKLLYNLDIDRESIISSAIYAFKYELDVSKIDIETICNFVVFNEDWIKLMTTQWPRA